MIVEWSCTTWSRIGVWGGEGVVGCRLVHGCFCIVLPYHWDKDVKFTFRHLEVRTPVAFFLVLLSFTQQSYCRGVGVRRPSINRGLFVPLAVK